MELALVAVPLAFIPSRYGQTSRLALATNGSLCHVWTNRHGRNWRGYAAANLRSNSTVGVESQQNARELVDVLLSLVDGSDRGALLGEQERGKVEQIVASLEQKCIPEPLKSPFLFGEWDVVYSSNPTATGGYYRSVIGRALLKTKEMVQIVKEPDFVSNKVSFAALGVLDGEVSLKGTLEALDNQWVQISFKSPYLKFGPFEFQYGGASSVKIAIIYLDERVRLGRGSRGSLFVFKRW
ncbi:hypothetical protein L7F22_000222 [Adiantum nelumboides]|nr:hypothetical protein [Adiantum nelumboides]